MLNVRHPSRTDDDKFHLVEDGIVIAKYDTIDHLAEWAMQESKTAVQEAKDAQDWADNLSDLLDMFCRAQVRRAKETT